MTLVLVPIPLDCLEGTVGYWRPYILSIAERSRNDPDAMTAMLFRGEAQAFLVWEAEAKKPLAFLGVRYVARGQERIGELIWLMGENRASWVHLFGELETYLRDHQGCVGIKAIARPGWSKHLKSNGYRITHYVSEKEFAP
jgi:hypothetical protein